MAVAAPARPQATLIAHHPGKIAAVVVTVALGLVLFPRWTNRRESGDAAGPGGSASVQGDPGLNQAAIGGGPPAGMPAGALPPGGATGPASGPGSGVVAGQVAIDVSTIPNGGAISLDSTPLAEPRVVLSLSDPSPHEIVAQAGCRRAVAEMTAADLASFKGALVMELKPRREDVMVGSEPSGARIFVNGRDAGKVTPSVLAIDGCEERTFGLQHAGFRPWSREYDADDDFEAMVEALKKVPLEAIPAGAFMVKKPHEYELEIYDGDRLIGRAGDTISLPEGKYALTFRNDTVFVKETAQVAVAGGRTVTPLINFPALGTLTVQAQPSNCKVFVDGVYVDVTPVLDMPIASGGHRVKVVFVPNDASQEVAVAVNGGKNARVMVKF